MRLGGWRLAKLALSAIAALTAATTAWVAVRRFDVGHRVAGAVSIALFCSPPLVGYATQVYPEMPAALAVVIGVAAITGSPSARNRILALTAIVVLPWLAIKYAPLAGVLALWLVLPDIPRLVARRGADRLEVFRTAATMVVLAVCGVVYLWFHQRVYGGWTVYASGDHFVDGEFAVVGENPNYLGRSRRLVGLLIDRRFGLIAWAPALLLAVPAVAATARRRSSDSFLVCSLLAAGWAVATWVALTMHGWWWPGRQVVVVLPMAVVAVAMFVDRRPRLLRTVLFLSLLSVINWLWLVFESSTGRRTLIVDFFETTSPLYRLLAPLLPDHQTPDTSDWIKTAAWSFALMWLAWLGWRSENSVGATDA